MTHLPVSPLEEPVEKKRRSLSKVQLFRLVGLVALAAVVAVFVFQNSQTVSVHFWFIDRHPPLIFVVLGCLLMGLLVGYVSGLRRGVRKARKRRLGRKDSNQEAA
jgi:uncharacterized integral membrane protein